MGRIKLTKEVIDLYNENYKKLMEKIEEDTNKWKNILCSWIGTINIVKCLHYPKQSVDSVQSLSIFQWLFFHRNRTNYPKICMEPQKTLNSLSSFKKEEESWMHHTPDFNFYYKAIILKQHVISIKTDRSLGQHRESRTQHVWPINL